jgi:hypothetical protein
VGVYRRYSVLIGFFLLVCILILLLSIPGACLTKEVSFVTTELYHSSGDDLNIKTETYFASGEQMQSFPKQIGDWNGYDYDATETQKALGAELLLMRGYYEPGLYQPLFLTIVQASTESSFHPPRLCHEGVGYKTAEEGRDTVSIQDPSWAEDGTPVEIPVNMLLVYKEVNNEVTERRVVLYIYVKGGAFASDTITMVEIEALAPLTGSYDGTLGAMKGFFAEAIPYMFEPADSEESTLLERLLQGGVFGYAMIVIMVLIPVAVAVYPRLNIRGLLDDLLSK